MEPKPRYKTKGNGRLRFDAIDMLRQARGLPTPDGYVVITKDFSQFIEDELRRLYAVTEFMDIYMADVAFGARPSIPLVEGVVDALELERPLPAAKREVTNV